MKKTPFNPKTIFALLCGLALLAACAPAGAAAPAGNTPAASVGTATVSSESASSAASYSDPFNYCTAVGTIDQPDGRYTGPKTPEVVVKGLMKASGVSADMPQEVFSQGTFWRCMDKQVYACFVGANLPCDSKANTSKEPTATMNEYCQANPNSDFIPAAATGHDTIYAWACKNGTAVTDQQVFHVDSQGYISEIWYAIPPQ
jgi:hypothetical protein